MNGDRLPARGQNRVAACLICCAALLAGCAETSRPGSAGGELPGAGLPAAESAPPTREGYEQAARDAREWRERAAAVGGEWRDVGPLLDQAAEAASWGDWRRAIELAESARFQAVMGYRQMKEQERVEHPAYLRF